LYSYGKSVKVLFYLHPFLMTVFHEWSSARKDGSISPEKWLNDLRNNVALLNRNIHNQFADLTADVINTILMILINIYYNKYIHPERYLQ